MLQELFYYSPRSRYVITNGNSDEAARAMLADIAPCIQQVTIHHLGIEMEHWTLHDLRSTACTNFSDLTEPWCWDISCP